MVITIQLWFPENQSDYSPYPWANLQLFNPFNKNYNVATYGINPYDVFSDLTSLDSQNAVYIFYDASTSSSYLIQPKYSEAFCVVSKVVVGGDQSYLIYEDSSSSLIPVELPYANGASSNTYWNDDIHDWITQTIKKPSATTNAHHAYKLIYGGQLHFNSVLNWNLFPNTILDQE